MIIRNKYNVPTKAWNRWSRPQRYAFNETYEVIKQDSDALYPQSFADLPAVTKRHIAWNTAWVVADIVKESQHVGE